MPQKRLRTAETAVRCDVGNAAAFCSAEEFGLPKCLLLGQRANSARRNARFWVSGGIRLAEMLAFWSADEFDLPNCLLFAQRRNSARRNACFWVSGGIRLAEMLAFRSSEEFGLSNCSLFSQRRNSACRTARFWISGRIRFAERFAFRAAHGVRPVISARIQGIASLRRRWRTQESTSRSASRHSGQVA